ncbi:MAG TPA: esterase, partial [Xanthobacteraceae bacterium]|nr:esterase [Xanthobacteraceae bacterium]
MRHAWLAIAVGLFALPAQAQAQAQDDIVLRGMGSFHIGGRIAEVTGKPVKEIQRVAGGPVSKLDPNGQFMVEQMYTQYFLPKNRKGKYPLLMWHGGGLTGVTYESTPDGREGWLNMFIRKGWDTYVSDAVERGRSGFASGDVWSDAPIFLNYQDPYERFRIGAGAGSWNADPAKRKLLPGNQFPVEAYDNYMRQSVPRWLSTDKVVVDAYMALVDKICPCVLLIHSQSG